MACSARAWTAARPGPATDPGKALFIDGDDDDVVRQPGVAQPLAEIEDQVIDAREDTSEKRNGQCDDHERTRATTPRSRNSPCDRTPLRGCAVIACDAAPYFRPGHKHHRPNGTSRSINHSLLGGISIFCTANGPGVLSARSTRRTPR
jgi:hypothetical protein